MCKWRHQELGDKSGALPIVVDHIPNVTHRRMAIADMHGAGRWNDTFGWPGLAANDQIVAAQIDLLERDRHQWKISLVMAASEGKRIDESRADLVPPDRFGDRLRIINMGENIGFWKEFAKTFEYFFASPHRDQPIMDNSHLHNRY